MSPHHNWGCKFSGSVFGTDKKWYKQSYTDNDIFIWIKFIDSIKTLITNKVIYNSVQVHYILSQIGSQLSHRYDGKIHIVKLSLVIFNQTNIVHI